MNALSAPVSGRSIVSWARASRDLAGLQCLHSAVLHLRLSGLLCLVVCLCSRGLSELWLPAHLSQVGLWWPAGPFLRGPATLGLCPRSAAATGWAAPARPGLPVPWAATRVATRPPAALNLRSRPAAATGWAAPACPGLPVPWAATRVATRPPAPLDLRPRSAAATGWVAPVRLGLPVPRCPAWLRAPPCCSA